MEIQIIAIREITKQIQGIIILVKSEESNESARRQSQITQNEKNKIIKRKNKPTVKSFVQVEYLEII